MENKKGNGVFLGVVAVATLIVAIIGATFAYFSITAQSAENAVNLSAYDTGRSFCLRRKGYRQERICRALCLDKGE